MIGEGPSLVEMLPSRLQEALERELQPGEKPVVALRGSTQEAVAALPDRLIRLVEGAGALGKVTAETYPLADVSGLTVRAALAGGPAVWGWGEDHRWTLARVTTLIARLFHPVPELGHGAALIDLPRR